MFPEHFEWLGSFPLPRTVNSALFVAAGDDWLVRALADAGKLFVPDPPQLVAGGLTVVGDAEAYGISPSDTVVETARPQLSEGARRLKPGSAFDPLRVGTSVKKPWLGDIAVSAAVEGIALGDDGKSVWILSGPREVVRQPLSGTKFRRPPYTSREIGEDGKPTERPGIFTARRINLDKDGQPVRSADRELFPE